MIHDMFGYGIQEGDYVAFGRREGNTSTIKVYQYLDGYFHPKWQPGYRRWNMGEPIPNTGHGWPGRFGSGRKFSSLDMTNSINLTRFNLDDMKELEE